MSIMRQIIAPVLGLMLLSACSSTTSPNTAALADFVTAIQATDGTTATETRSGSPPAASGGPAVTATIGNSSSTSGTVSNGGATLVQLRAASPFNQIFVSVIDDPLDGFFTLTLPVATTTAAVVIDLGRTIPVNAFQLVFSVKTPGGQVGPSTSVADTVTAATTTSYTGVWSIGSTATQETGSCTVAGNVGGDPLNTFRNVGQATVSSSGSVSVAIASSSSGATLPGTMNLSSGAWSIATTFPAGCGTDPTATFSASGTCSSFTACSGTFSITSSPSGNTESGTITWFR